MLVTQSIRQRAAALRRRAERKPLWQWAGETLLIECGSWMLKDDFCAEALVSTGDGGAVIHWDRAGEILTGALVAGATEGADLVVLAFAVALGTDRFGLSKMDADRQWQLLTAVARVVHQWTGAAWLSSLTATPRSYAVAGGWPSEP